MGNFIASRALCPHCSAFVCLVLDQQLAYWDAVMTPRTAAEDGSVSSHRMVEYIERGSFMERYYAASSSNGSDGQHKIGAPTTVKVEYPRLLLTHDVRTPTFRALGHPTE